MQDIHILVMGDKMIAFHKNNKKEYIKYTVRIEENILEQIREIANREQLSINEVINQSLEMVINKYKKEK